MHKALSFIPSIKISNQDSSFFLKLLMLLRHVRMHGNRKELKALLNHIARQVSKTRVWGYSSVVGSLPALHKALDSNTENNKQIMNI